jgi:hypothetical protein
MNWQELVIAVLTGLGTAGAWAIDRFRPFNLVKTKPIDLNGEWNGWSVFRNVRLKNVTKYSDSEVFFKIKITIRQRFSRIYLEESIEEIYNSIGEKTENQFKIGSVKRIFSGVGQIMNDGSICVIFNEKQGLTCGTFLLKPDPWLTSFSGLMTVRNVDGTPVVCEIFLNKSPAEAKSITEMVDLEKSL